MKHVVAALTLAAATLVAASPARAQAATWNIDSAHSAASFAVTHMMVTTVRGEFGKMSGQVGFDGSNFASVQVEATIDASTVTTREPKRDEHLKSADFFDVANFPTITFKSKKADPVGPGKFRLVGDLTMRGVTKEVVLDVAATEPVKGGRGETRMGATATTKLNRKEFGVNWNRALDTGGVVVSDEVAVTIDLALVKKDSAPKTSN